MKLGHRAFSHVPASVLAVLACGVPAHFVIAADGDPTVEGYRTRQQELLDSQTAILARLGWVPLAALIPNCRSGFGDG